ncbi:facilitated trehalose transporter Tret1-like [Manduca sexta]|uniref:facilitated trehalose transporter Tret1-like n=1 Tax=Manduca sexta TaxID=7130 RepID=UPI00188F60E8|nr:facilitated trehalose transporter Tret1-like [Manduca sexta]
MTINGIENVLSRVGIQKSRPIYNQIFATFAPCLLFISAGMTFGITGVLLPKLQEDPDFPYDRSYDSWIASISPLAMMLGCLFAGAMSDGLGRKMGQLALVPFFVLGWCIMGFAKDITLMLVGRFITGLCTGSIRPNGMVYIGEVTQPEYRSITLFCPTLAVHIGALISHIVGNYFYWRTSCFIFGLPNILCFLILLFLKESPLWLITKGKTDEGIEAFRLFRGEGEAADKELASVLEKQKEKPVKMTFSEFIHIIFSKGFMKALVTVFLLFSAMQLCGVNMISFYAQDVFKKTFSGEIDPFMLMIVTDCIRVAAAAGVCVFAKFCPRKLTFLTCCFLTTTVLFALVIYLYLQPSGLTWLALLLMVAYVVIASAITSLSWSFVAEIFPGSVRGFGSGLSSGISFILLFVAVKITPGVMTNYGDIVMYGGFATVTLIASVFLCFILPETNGKTLQDIENSLYKKKNQNESNAHQMQNVTV